MVATLLPPALPLVLFGAHRWNRVGLIRSCQRAGFSPLIVTGPNEVLHPELARLLHVSQVLRHRLDPAAMDDLRRAVTERIGPDFFALGLDDYVCHLAACLPTTIERRCFEPNAAETTRHKDLLRAMWNEAAKLHPALAPVEYQVRRFESLNFDGEGDVLSESEGFDVSAPAVIKPRSLDASIAVYDCSAVDFATIRTALSIELTEVAAYAQAAEIHVAPELIIEHRIARGTTHPGGEFSAEVLSLVGQPHRLLGITQKYLSASRFIEVAHVFPAPDFPRVLREPLLDALTKMLDDLGVRFGVSHWEFIVTPENRIALVEGQLRPAGDRICELIEMVLGADPISLLLESLRCLPTRNLSTDGFAGVFFLQPEVTLPEIASVECGLRVLAQWSPQIEAAELLSVRNWEGPVNSFQKLISIVGRGSAPKELRADARQAAKQIVVHSPTGQRSAMQLVLPQ